jgi:lipopolysaccharide transport system ATP-binding protein
LALKIMAQISIHNASVDFPIYSAKGRAIKHFVLNAATGGKLLSDPSGRVTVRALENINLEFKDGDRVALLGHNGSGKTTLLRVIAGVYRPSSGYARVDGSVGSLIDIFLGTDPEATGLENIFLRAAMMGLTKVETEALVDEVVEFSELADFIRMPIRTYSSGMNFRLAFSISTICRPDILVMDEWLATGDVAFQKKAEERLNTLIEATKILVVATHSKDLANKICNKVVELEHGRIVCKS